MTISVLTFPCNIFPISLSKGTVVIFYIPWAPERRWRKPVQYVITKQEYLKVHPRDLRRLLETF